MSDSSFVKLLLNVPENGLGFIARPTSINRKGADCNDQSRFCEWDGKSTYRIINESNTLRGMHVTKVGWRTGRTQGVVTAINTWHPTCEDHQGNDVCTNNVIGQARALYQSKPGDSGSPVVWARGSSPPGSAVDTRLPAMPSSRSQHLFLPYMVASHPIGITINLDGVPKAVSFCLIFKKSYISLNIGYDDTVRDIAKLVFVKQLERAIEKGCVRFDVGQGDNGWKSHFNLPKIPQHVLTLS